MELREPVPTGLHSKAGRVLLIFGTIDAIRVIHEIHDLWRDANSTYLRLVALDGVLAMATIVASVVILKHVAWGPLLAASVGAASVVPTIASGMFLLPEVIDMWRVWRSQGDSYYLKLLLPQALFDAVKIVFWPYAFRLLQRDLAPDDSRKRGLRLWVGLSILTSAAVIGIIFMVH